MGNAGDVKFQYLAAIFVNIASISFGAFCGWPSASFLELSSKDSPLETGPLTHQDQGNVASVLCLGGLLGNIFFVWLAERIGRKGSLLWTTLPCLLGWIGIPYARNPAHLIAARFLGGFGGGGGFGVIPIYVAELAEDSVRGVLGTFLILTCNVGVLLVFVLGYYFNYATVAWMASTLCIAFVVCFWFMPETPQHLLQLDKLQEAEQSLRYYRNIRARVSKELSEELQLELHRLRTPEKVEPEDDCIEDNKNRLSWADFTEPTARKACLIGLGLLLSNQGCGCFALLNYTAVIFEASGASMPPTLAAIMVGVIQLLGTYASTLLVERAGRKPLLLISGVGICLSQCAMCAHSYLKSTGYDTSGYDWLPVVAFSFMLFIACWGLLTLPFMVVAEILPPKIRSTGMMMIMSVLWMISMTTIKCVPLLIANWGMHGTILMFACLTLCGTLFIAICVPETKGKSVEQILASL